MRAKAKIALTIPGAGKTNNYFLFRLQGDLFNEPSEFCKPTKLLAISDIEGNFQAFSRLLIKSNVIDRYFNWTFGDGHLVVVGDCFDRGEHVTECLWLIYSLEEKARKKGGYVHFILGNHEIMNMNGDWRYVHPKYAQNVQKKNIHLTALYYGNNELWQWLRTKNIVEKIGDILFVHGGIANELLSMNLSVTEINNRVRPFYTQSGKVFTDPLLNIVFASKISPFWYRGYYQALANMQQIDATLAQFGVKRIVTGHTIMNQITSFFNDKVINIDTDHASGNSEALLIKKEKLYRIDRNGNKKRILHTVADTK
jgi:hypothetical protein